MLALLVVGVRPRGSDMPRRATRLHRCVTGRYYPIVSVRFRSGRNRPESFEIGRIRVLSRRFRGAEAHVSAERGRSALHGACPAILVGRAPSARRYMLAYSFP